MIYLCSRSREQVSFLAACSLGIGGAGFELNYRDKMKEPPFLTVPTFVTYEL